MSTLEEEVEAKIFTRRGVGTRINRGVERLACADCKTLDEFPPPRPKLCLSHVRVPAFYLPVKSTDLSNLSPDFDLHKLRASFWSSKTRLSCLSASCHRASAVNANIASTCVRRKLSGIATQFSFVTWRMEQVAALTMQIPAQLAELFLDKDRGVDRPSLILSVSRKPSIVFSFWLEPIKLRRVFVILYVEIECISEQVLIMILTMRDHGDDRVRPYDEIRNLSNVTSHNRTPCRAINNRYVVKLPYPRYIV
ncbi:hypothetical protein J6590_095228 [Homalodisca vitripennis]|nr:hypothetical protein J6590_095228 [Homalodisca vitripennis]